MKTALAMLGAGLAGFVVVIGAFGCEASATAEGSSSGGADGGQTFEPPPPGLSEVDAQKLCEAIRKPYCDRLNTCSANAVGVFYGDLQTCYDRNVAECKLAMMLPGVTVTLAQGEACGAAYAARACDSVDPIPACSLPGVVADGGPCMSNSQCKSGYCDGGTSGACGKCEVLPATGAAIGAACTTSKDCVAWASCKEGKCAEAGRVKGQDCTENDGCIIEKGLGCDSFQKCQEISSVVEGGQPCPTDDATSSGVGCKDGLCNEQEEPAVCLSRVPAGGDCGGSLQLCSPPYYCEPASKKCSLPVLDYDATCNIKR